MKQYWADAATQNCVWCFQKGWLQYGENGCTCREFDEDGEPIGDECTCGVEVWHTQRVFLTHEECIAYGRNSGEFGKDWRIWGVPCDGIMAELLGLHAKEFEDKVEYIG